MNDDYTYRKAYQLLQSSVSPEETAALTGLRLEIIVRLDAIRQSESAARHAPESASRLRDALRTDLHHRLCESIHELFEHGYDAAEICQALAELVSTIGGTAAAQPALLEQLMRRRMDRKQPPH